MFLNSATTLVIVPEYHSDGREFSLLCGNVPSEVETVTWTVDGVPFKERSPVEPLDIDYKLGVSICNREVHTYNGVGPT